MTIKVLADILSDSPSPAIVLSGIALKSSPNIPQQQSLRKITVSSAASQIVEGGTTSTKAIFSSTLRTQIKALTHRAPFNLLHPGDTAAFIFPNSFEFICCFFSTVAVRAVAAPLNPALKAKEVEWYLKDMTAKCLIIPGKDCAATIDPEITASIWSDLVPMARRIGIPVFYMDFNVVGDVRITVHHVDSTIKMDKAGPLVPPITRSDDYALFLHTSGTTGPPKCVPLTHGNILRTLSNIKETYHLEASDVSYLVMPLFHVHGLIGVLLSALLSGGTVVIPPKFSVTRFWNDFLGCNCTWYSAVPTIHQMLLLKAKETYPGNNGKLRFIRSCSSALAPATLLQLEQTFNAPVIEAYAMTEAAHQMTANFLPPGIRKPGSVGRGRGVDVAILDDNGKPVAANQIGEICVRGANVIKGYFKNPSADAKSFFPDPYSSSNKDKSHCRSSDNNSNAVKFHGSGKWFRTGDLGYKDVSDFVFIVGRIKEQINRGGEKISPVEIDNIILQMEGIAEAVTFGAPDAVYGQAVEVAIVLKSTHINTLTEKSITDYCTSKMAAFKVPRKVHIVEQIPKSATGKVQRRNVSDFFHKQSRAKL